MNGRERFHRVMHFQPVDRVPLIEIGWWPETWDRWLADGMPPDTLNKDLAFDGHECFGLERQGGVEVSLSMCPAFKPEVLEEDERYRIWRDENGTLRKAMRAGGSMDTYLRFTVECREDFENLKWRFNPASPARYPEWWNSYANVMQQRDYPLRMPALWGMRSINGFFGTLRTWMGTERACTLFYNDPAWAHEMLDFIADFVLATLERALRDIQADYFIWWEDYAYKAGPLVSPRIFKQFLLPRYRRVNDVLRQHGIDVIFQDSDGDTRVLLPLMLDAGINGIWPIEAASGMDPVALRQQYGHDLLLWGGVDKRVLAQDRRAIEEELRYKLPPLLADGGYIPTLDHTAPPDIPYENWLYYLALKRDIVEKG